MEAKHTQGELKYASESINPDWAVVTDANGSVVANVPDVVSAPAMRQMPAEANARRLVACWNACQSIPTEALEAGVVGELVEACRTLVDSSLPAWPGRSAIEIAHKALAKAKGGK